MIVQKKVLCIGDSITKGHPGVSYVNFLEYKCINKGLSGDTLLGVIKRLENIMQKKYFNTIDCIVVGVGANDVIQPYLNDYSNLWKLRVKMLKKRGSIHSACNKTFELNFKKLIKILKSTNKNIIIFSMPYLETNEKTLNNKINELNKIIKTECNNNEIPFINFYKWQYETKNKNNDTSYAFMSKNPICVGIDTFLTSYLKLSKYVSNKRNLLLTVDGCHLNTFSAQKLSDMINEYL